MIDRVWVGVVLDILVTLAVTIAVTGGLFMAIYASGLCDGTEGCRTMTTIGSGMAGAIAGARAPKLIRKLLRRTA